MTPDLGPIRGGGILLHPHSIDLWARHAPGAVWIRSGIESPIIVCPTRDVHAELSARINQGRLFHAAHTEDIESAHAVAAEMLRHARPLGMALEVMSPSCLSISEAELSIEAPLNDPDDRTLDMRVEKVVETMPEPFRSIIRMQYLAGMSPREIAGLTGMDIDKVREAAITLRDHLITVRDGRKSSTTSQDDRKLMAAMMQAIEEMKEPRRQILLMIYRGNRSLAEVEQRFGIDDEACKEATLALHLRLIQKGILPP